MSDTTLAKKYHAADVEPEIWARWEAADAFHPSPDGPGEPYSIVIPPPNVTAALHLGHALNNTLQDVLIRWRRMCGDNAVWLPGTDHAGIATQTVVEKRVLAEEGKKRTEFERDEFVAKIQAWKDEYEKVITNQLRTMGCSCDWKRQAFTMDDMRAKAVREAFFRLFSDGLIYRGKRLVNWDPATQTALADDEVEMHEIDGHFYYMKYPLVDDAGNDTGEFVTVATTRPETMLGDTAVAVNPTDAPRAKHLGQTVRLPIVNRPIPVVGDDYVVKPDPESSDEKAKFASGYLKVTPAHDQNDWAIGQRHDLPVINVMAPDGTISKEHDWLDWGQYDHDEFLEDLLGMDRYEARKAIVDWFGTNGLLDEVKPYRHSVGHSYRSHVPIEPYLSDQWYLRVTDQRLAGAALRAMAPDQRSEGECVWSEVHPFDVEVDMSRDRKGAVQQTKTYMITWSTYGTPLHGEPRGSVHHQTNLPGQPLLEESDCLEAAEADQLVGEPYVLDQRARPVTRDTLVEVCQDRGWQLLAANVRSDHVHVVVHGDDTPEKIMGAFKSYVTRRLREDGLVDDQGKCWTRHGSTRWLNSCESVDRACEYVIDKQGKDLGGVFGPVEFAHAAGPQAHGRRSLSAAAGQLRFTPARYAKTFQTWHENIRDWCISRQLWWGHRIPVWSKDGQHEFAKPQAACRFADGRTYVCLLEDNSELISEIESNGFTQDPDVLDTWFSSALWPMSTLGWPEHTPELARWNPTAVLSTAREIITLWVSRMVMFNCYFRGQLPFRDVFIHAMIQDGEGRKMSKSLGNGVDPLDIIHSHGSDAMRFTLAMMTTQTQDVRMPVERDAATGRNTSPKFDIGRNFANKLWNASRFVLGNLEQAPSASEGSKDGESQNPSLGLGAGAEDLSLSDRWILSRTARTITAVDKSLAEYDFHAYGQAMYQFVWNDLCDWYIEVTKPIVREPAGATTRRVLATVIDVALRLLHPSMPFITEKLWEALNQTVPRRGVRGLTAEGGDLLIRAPWPVVDSALIDDEAEARFDKLQTLIAMIREVRSSTNTPPRDEIEVSVKTEASVAAMLQAHVATVEALARVKVLAMGPEVAKPDGAAVVVRPLGEMYLHQQLDAEDEVERLTKRLKELEGSEKALSGRLNNKGYTEKAPGHLVQETRDQLAGVQAEIQVIRENLKSL